VRIDFTPAAAARVEAELPGGHVMLKLLYDTEGCGCVMSGVPTLLSITEPEDGDERAEGGPIEVWFQKRYEVFFEDALKIDAKEGSLDFVLKSDNQIYTTNLRLLRA
jgi:uncharacterized protein YqkB